MFIRSKEHTGNQEEGKHKVLVNNNNKKRKLKENQRFDKQK